MKKLFLLFCFMAIAVNAQTKSLPANQFNPKKGDLLIDVRTPEEFNEGHLPNAINMNYFDSSFIERISKLSKSKKVYLYCKTGIRSEKAAKAMAKAGFTKVYVLEGGILAWKAARKPIKS